MRCQTLAARKLLAASVTTKGNRIYARTQAGATRCVATRLEKCKAGWMSSTPLLHRAASRRVGLFSATLALTSPASPRYLQRPGGVCAVYDQTEGSSQVVGYDPRDGAAPMPLRFLIPPDLLYGVREFFQNMKRSLNVATSGLCDHRDPKHCLDVYGAQLCHRLKRNPFGFFGLDYQRLTSAD